MMLIDEEKLMEDMANEKDFTKLIAEIVGASIGITKNMENYESLRVDCWLTDTVKENETVEQAYERILGIIDKTMQDTVNSYL